MMSMLEAGSLGCGSWSGGYKDGADVLTETTHLKHDQRFAYATITTTNTQDNMLASSIFFAFALSAVGIAQEVDNNDVPNECRDVCASIVTLARQCGDQFGTCCFRKTMSIAINVILQMAIAKS